MAKIQLTPKAVLALREVQKQIRKAPTSFDMSVIAEKARGRGKSREIVASVVIDHELLPPCGTTACIAGWTLIKAGQESEGNSPLVRAAEILGLSTYDDSHGLSEASRLFLSSRWPKYSRADGRLITKLYRLDNTRDDRLAEGKSVRLINSRIKATIKARGRLAIKRIDLLIKKGI